MAKPLQMIVTFEVSVCLSSCTDNQIAGAPWEPTARAAIDGAPAWNLERDLCWVYDEFAALSKRIEWLLPQLPPGGVLIVETVPMGEKAYRKLLPDMEPL